MFRRGQRPGLARWRGALSSRTIKDGDAEPSSPAPLGNRALLVSRLSARVEIVVDSLGKAPVYDYADEVWVGEAGD